MSALLQNKSFRTAWTAQCFYQMASSFVEMTVLYRVGEMSASGFAVSLLFFLLKFPVLFMGIISGVLVDRYDRRRLLVWSMLTRVGISVVLMLLVGNLWALLVSVLLLALFGNLYRTAEGALIPEIVENEHLTQAAGFFNMTEHGTTLLGLALVFGINGWLDAEGLFNGYSSAVTLGIGALLFTIGVVFQRKLAKMPLAVNKCEVAEEEQPKPKRDLSFRGIMQSWKKLQKELAEGLLYVKSSIWCRRMIVHLIVTNMIILTVISMAEVFGSEYLLTVSMVEVGKFVILPILFGFVVSVAALPYIQRKYFRMNVIAYGGIGSALAILAMGLFKLLFPWTGVEWWARWIIYALLFLIGAFAVLTFVPSYVILQEQAENKVRGRALGILFSTIVGLSAIPLLVSGAIMDRWGVVPLLIGLGAMLMLYGSTLFRYAKEERLANGHQHVSAIQEP